MKRLVSVVPVEGIVTWIPVRRIGPRVATVGLRGVTSPGGWSPVVGPEGSRPASTRGVTRMAWAARALLARRSRAASMAALRASRLVWSAISLIRLTIPPIFSALACRLITLSMALRESRASWLSS